MCNEAAGRGRHIASKINRAVSIKIAIEDGKRCNILAKRDREREREAEDSQSEKSS